VRQIAAIGLMRLASWGEDSERAKRLLGFDPQGDVTCADHLAAAVASLGLEHLSDGEPTRTPGRSRKCLVAVRQP
jgi:hypothetical protein